jgi:hypothetical protein
MSSDLCPKKRSSVPLTFHPTFPSSLPSNNMIAFKGQQIKHFSRCVMPAVDSVAQIG